MGVRSDVFVKIQKRIGWGSGRGVGFGVGLGGGEGGCEQLSFCENSRKIFRVGVGSGGGGRVAGVGLGGQGGF